MATSTFATSRLNLLFERQYGKFIDQLNYGFEILDHMSRKKAEFDGEFFYYPVTVARSGHGRYQGEGQNQPTPHGVEDETIRFDVTEYMDKISFTWRFLAQSKSKRLHSKLAQRIQRVIKENREFCDKTAIFGNVTRGFISERFAGGPIAAGNPLGGIYAGLHHTTAVTMDYDGDHTRFAGANLADPATWVPVNVRCLDDYQAIEVGHGITLNGANANVGLFITGSSAANGTVDLVLVTDNAASELEIDATQVQDGFAMGVELKNQLNVGAAAIAIGNRQFGAAVPGDAQYEMSGIFSNLAAGSYGNVDRSNANYASLRSTCLTMGSSGVHARTDFSAARLQQWLDEILVLGGGEPTAFWMSPLMRSRYVAAVTTVLTNTTSVANTVGAVTTTTESASAGGGRYQTVNGGKGDIGVKTIEYAGYAMRTALNMPKGLVVGLSDECWVVLTVGGNLIDFRRQGNSEEGPLFYDAEGTTTANAVLYGIHQLVCDRPNYGNGVLCGISLS